MERRKEFNFLWKSKSPYKMVVGARSCGKTVATLQYVVEKILRGQPNCKAAFCSSTLGQVEKTIDTPMRLISKDLPEGFMRHNKTKRLYSFVFDKYDIREIQMLSYTDPDALRGYHPDIIVLDECGKMGKIIYSEVILPMLSESGELIAIGTANGNRNQFYEFYKQGISEEFPEWEAYVLKASEHPNLFSPKLLAERKRNMTEKAYLQEMECDFEANIIVGGVYSEYLSKFVKDAGHIGDFEWNPRKPVYTSWDLGYTSFTAIWFYQVIDGVVTFIDYYENNKKEIPFYADVLNKLPYNIVKCYLPHDGASHNVRGGPVIEQLEAFGFKCEIVPKTFKHSGVEEARTMLKTCRFKEKTCQLGLDRLYNFSYKMNWHTGEACGEFEDDDNSHGADAFRYAAQSLSMMVGSDNKEMRVVDYNVLRE